MTKPARIPLAEIVRAVRAGQKMGAKSVRIEMNGVAVEVRLEDAYIGEMSQGHPPAPAPASEGSDQGKFVW